ncbi:MAG: tetratricopeptide repeat protein [Terriglobia bacterium]
MRRDLVVTALVFIVVGFVGGYIYTQQTGEQRLSKSSPLLADELAGEEALGLPPGHPSIDVAQRMRELRAEAEQNPEDIGAALRLAYFLMEVGRCQDAIAWYERGLRLEPNNTDTRIALANCLFETGQHDAALQHLNTVLALKPNEPHALYHLVVTRLRGKRDLPGAERAYRQLRQANPNFAGLEELERLLGEFRGRASGPGAG